MFVKDQTIVCIDNQDNFLLTKGKEYKVLSSKYNGDYVTVICDSDRQGTFLNERFVLKDT